MQFELWKVMHEGQLQEVECVDFLAATDLPLMPPGVTRLREYPAVEKAEALRGAAIAKEVARIEAENFMVE
jgi:hypothetical protein